MDRSSRINLRAISVGFSLCSILAAAAMEDQTWPNREFSTWNETDARNVLNASPWAKLTTPVLLPGLSAWQRRDGGDMAAEGGGKNTKLDLSDVTGYHTKDRAATRTDLDFNGIPRKILIRWESAGPLRFAEIKAKDDEAPDVDGEDYAVAVYSVPLKAAMPNFDLRTLPGILKQNTLIKVAGRKDIKPSRVVLRQQGSDVATIVFFFSRSARFSTEDKRLDFVSLVGRMSLTQSFFPPDMVFQGKLEL
jgi:hypothetical protein